MYPVHNLYKLIGKARLDGAAVELTQDTAPVPPTN
jgi:hypothetical protein